MGVKKRDIVEGGRPVVLRAGALFHELEDHLFADGDDQERGTFIRCGWRETDDVLVLSLVDIVRPDDGDVSGETDQVAFHAPYLVRVATEAEADALAIGVVHSHPSGADPLPSALDHELDRYLSQYFRNFANDRPFVSLIMSSGENGRTELFGRAFWKGRWRPIARTLIAGEPALSTWHRRQPPTYAAIPPDRVARLTSAFGREAWQRLRDAHVAVIGAGGSGSAAIPLLARAGVGRITIVDSDFVSESNLERVHASWPEHAAQKMPKARLAMEHVERIDPDVKVTGLIGRLPQPEVVDHIVDADFVMGCTDRHSSRLAISDLSTRYLIPAIDTGGLIEGENGKVTGQIAQFARLFPDDACVRCRRMINLNNVQAELNAGDDWARSEGEEQTTNPIDGEMAPPLPEETQIDTVGYMTTAMGALSAGYVIGWLTGRFEAPFERLQINLLADHWDVTDQHQERQEDCVCGLLQGHADQGGEIAYPVPSHWPPVRVLRSEKPRFDMTFTSAAE